MTKKLLPFILSLVFCLSAAGCETKPAGGDVGLALWTASGTEKIMQDVDYSERHGTVDFNISAVRGEYESAQIILSPEKAVSAYSISLNDLKTKEGDTLPANAFTVYNQKYIRVENIKSSSIGTPPGMYPDALLPFEAAVEHGENKVEGGANQGIWITLLVPAGQKAGVYSGKFSVVAEGKNYDVPATVTVYDYTLSQVTHSKSSFMVRADYVQWAELDSSEEMYDAYYNYLLDYRVNPQHLTGNDMQLGTKMTSGQLEKFLYYAKRSTLDDRCSHFNIPFTTEYVSLPSGSRILSVDFDDFENTLRAMAEYSAREKVNLFKKAGTYFIFFDEYDLNGTEVMAAYNLNTAQELCESLSERLKTELACEEPALKAEIVKGLYGIKHKAVGTLNGKLDVEKALSVPTVDRYHTKEGRATYEAFAEKSYGDDAELWTYTCNVPIAPYPTYHTEDILLSSRLLSWMMYDYNIVGNLYWNAAHYAVRDLSINENLQVQDYYETVVRHPGANGDGYLVYPGRPYGIYGPVGTVRLNSIRDGNEDYDLFYALKEMYTAQGVTEESFNELTQLLYDNLFSGTKVRSTSSLLSHFSQSRKTLSQLLAIADSADTVVSGIGVSEAETVVSVSAPSTVEIYRDGQELSGTQSGGRTEYTIRLSVETAKILQLEIVAEKGRYSLNLSAGTPAATKSATILRDDTTFPNGDGAVAVEQLESKDVLRVNFNASDRVDFNVLPLSVTADTLDVTFKIYSYAGTAVEFSILIRNERSVAYDSIATVSLSPGWNEITLSSTELNCSQNGRLSAVRFAPKKTGALSVSFGGIAIRG